MLVLPDYNKEIINRGLQRYPSIAFVGDDDGGCGGGGGGGSRRRCSGQSENVSPRRLCKSRDLPPPARLFLPAKPSSVDIQSELNKTKLIYTVISGVPPPLKRAKNFRFLFELISPKLLGVWRLLGGAQSGAKLSFLRFPGPTTTTTTTTTTKTTRTTSR